MLDAAEGRNRAADHIADLSMVGATIESSLTPPALSGKRTLLGVGLPCGPHQMPGTALTTLVIPFYGQTETYERTKPMKRTFALIPAALATAALFGGLVYAVLIAANVSEPAATTVYGPTSQRLWATTVAGLALIGVVIGGLALARPAGRFGAASGRLGAIVALTAGLIAVINGGLVLVMANGGPGTGNGVVGGAGALVLGLIAMALGGLALARSRRLG